MSTPALMNRRDLLRGATVTAGALLLDEACGGSGMPPAASPATAAATVKIPGGLEVRGNRFYRDGKPFFVSGFNYWSAMPLAREGNTAGWDQVRRDLDQLQAAGINMLRIMGATEGPDTEPLRIVPSLQPSPGQYDAASMAGIVRLVQELEQRKLYAIFTMNNFWHWSGGMAQYLSWAGQGPVPYPPPAPGGNWDRYQKTAGQFYTNEKAKKIYVDLLNFVVPKVKGSPAVIWELANEPRGMNNVAAYRKWIDQSAALIHALAPGQLVTTGSEGQTASPYYAGVDVGKDHESPNIDFVTFHMWAENWGWVDKRSLEHDFPRAMALATKYINDHVARVAKLNKPLLLEEFGFPRDGGSFDPDSPTTLRDKYFNEVYGMVHSLMPTTSLAGIMPWAWAGDVRPPRPGEYWKPGDPFIGDPPHEQQGWYSVYSKDTTVQLIKSWSGKLVS
jgi:mannan endo-1,4-beta-mannosidase